MNQPAVMRNDASRERLGALAGRLSDADLRRVVGGGWTVAALLAHLAFWDRYVLARWEDADRTGQSVPPIIGDIHLDLTNAAALPQWRALDPRFAARDALDAAAAVDDRIRRLTPEQVAAVESSGRPALVDRSVHRSPHLDEIDHALLMAR